MLLGDKPTPCPPTPSPQTKINPFRGDLVVEVGGGWWGPSLSAGVIDSDVRSQCTFPVACQPDACWQVGRPPGLTARARQGTEGEEGSERRGDDGGQKQTGNSEMGEKNSWRGDGIWA